MISKADLFFIPQVLFSLTKKLIISIFHKSNIPYRFGKVHGGNSFFLGVRASLPIPDIIHAGLRLGNNVSVTFKWEKPRSPRLLPNLMKYSVLLNSPYVYFSEISKGSSITFCNFYFQVPSVGSVHLKGLRFIHGCHFK